MFFLDNRLLAQLYKKAERLTGVVYNLKGTGKNMTQQSARMQQNPPSKLSNPSKEVRTQQANRIARTGFVASSTGPGPPALSEDAHLPSPKWPISA